MARTLVMKFGGTSVGTAEAMKQAAAIVRDNLAEWPRIVVVTSALSGVTNMLLAGASKAAAGDVQTYVEAGERMGRMHTEIAETLVTDQARQAQVRQEISHLLSDFNNLCQAISVLGEATPRAMDAVASLGERMSIRLLAAALEACGVPAQDVESTQLVVTDAHFQSAHPDFEATTLKTRQVLLPLLDAGRVPVVTGFIGATPQGLVTTLGRGGSDYSAAILGAVLPADDVWIWTDVDGVMSADPRMAPDAATIEIMNYKEISELAYFGAKVLHPKTIRPVIEAGIGLRVCNTFNPAHPGTRLVAELPVNTDGQIKAVTVIPNLKLITIEGRGMLGVPGVAARTFGAVAGTGTSVPMITQASSEQSICFAVPAEAAADVTRALESAFESELASRDIDRVHSYGEVAIVTVVGAGMRHTPGIAGRVFSSLGAENVNVIAIAQGSSEVSISLVVDSIDSRKAVLALHRLTALPVK